MKQIKQIFLEDESSTLTNLGPTSAGAVTLRAGINEPKIELAKAVSSNGINDHGVIDANIHLLNCLSFNVTYSLAHYDITQKQEADRLTKV